MIHLLMGVIHLIAFKFINIFYYAYIISCLIGKGFLYVLCEIYFGILASFVGLTIFMEEFLIFFKEIILILNNILSSIEVIVSNSVGGVFKYIQTEINAIRNLLYIGKLKTQTICFNIFDFISHLFFVINGAILLIGDGLWYIITLGPRLIELSLNSIAGCVYSLANILANLIKSVMKDVFQYSLVLCAFFILLMCRHRIKNAVSLLMMQLKNLLTNWIAIIQRFTIRFLTLTGENKEKTEYANTSRVEVRTFSDCVICQEQPKCILMLPCKHLCMCKECYDKYNAYQMNCPMCRRPIIDAFPIYV